MSTDQDRRLRAELARELGFWPATLDSDDIAQHRLAAAADRGKLGLEEIHRRWAWYREEKRRCDAEEQGRSDVADL
ncbi:hypothetical protein [Mycolicibacterium alvei]|uniref:Uncharacterized protein n=1 Tax=Mycolicibacterium alvei TaxID=67081 RepID=A0A6N4UP38_9MYCO|nr:hypothetical protein [Mycolicibacterium alvei]MCV6998655.1 hypothetical protein [Mycolicibacterium alvei]BBX25414.1 hypothetical protein MALV_05390 [Mycolicibacterium alvei]